MTDDKIARFERLYQLDDFPEDHINDTNDTELFLKRPNWETRNPPVSKPLKRASSPIRGRREPEVINLTSFSSPPPEIKKIPINSTTAEKPSRKARDVQSKRKPTRKIPTPEPKHIDPIVALMTGQKFSPLPVKGKGKKRDPPLKMAHESRQVFKGLHFYFYPNKDIGVRKLRIRKAIEFGVIWEREWSEKVTHVIVDSGFTRQNLLRTLKIHSLPEHVILVNEVYPIDCASQFGFLVEPNQPLYRVDPGLEPALATPSISQVSEDQSPQLKPVRKKTSKLIETPPRTSDSAADRLFVRPRGGNRGSPSPSETVNQVHRNALDEAIDEARKFKDLPLGPDDDEDSSVTPVTHYETDGEEEIKHPAKRQKKEANDNGFQCMQKHDALDRDTNSNTMTIKTLQDMADYYTRIGDTWRPIAYRKAIASLRKQTSKITSAEEAVKLPSVGKRLALKIEEIACTNSLRRLENVKSDPQDQLLGLFCGIYGVGHVQASKWIDQGYHTLEDLRANAKLTANQKVGIDHYDDFKSRIPRAEVENHGEIVERSAHAIDPMLKVTIMGSYRRGAETCGDVDFLVTKENAPIHELRNILIDELIPSLFEQNFLKASLAVTSKSDGSKWHGACSLPGRVDAPWRRIDFLLVPSNEIGAALIYFTGNDIFNKSIRLLASRKGMRLNQHGLWTDVFRGHNRQKLNQGMLVESRSEERIFELLGVPYRPPEHRNC